MTEKELQAREYIKYASDLLEGTFYDVYNYSNTEEDYKKIVLEYKIPVENSEKDDYKDIPSRY